ncbi:rhophilin-2 [Anopheles aquasalis]|uniref:rhophilin-2 n=1 Tax=Anopheles aquasalis TaxID=42839 RepID=UPI00215A668D|nr:rhophilin-2 [Anopheles aquasalis]XP_050099555.1 rhophilin-2 [Anopheles aquasalis]XP_050099556.1 rhophilin-2 [Anopheles aquasalis]XP_050099557.1 rhophilin-2 [Anopheles aquasalis]
MGFLQDLQLKGSDPRAATCRSKLQTKRCKLNQEINKELRLRAGAENLYKATTNKKLKDTVALELSFVNSNLQLLKEQLSELNSSVEIYQSEGLDYVIPMIPLGLKETKEMNFMEAFSDFILEHYSENSQTYEDAIADITDTRQAAKTPTRDMLGVSLLFRYYNLLYYVERRFFPSDRSLGVYFEWYDSLTGVPSCQRTVAFEKACILFNLGAIYTQIGAKQDRSLEKGLDAAVDNFLRAAGVFRHIFDTFTNAPSMDLKPQVLEVLVALMLAQARECLYEKLLLQLTGNPKSSSTDEQHHHQVEEEDEDEEENEQKGHAQIQRDLAGEATQVALEYQEIHRILLSNDAHTYLPECWAGLVPLKSEYYKALAHYHTAKAVRLSGRDNKHHGARHGDDTFIFDELSLLHEPGLDVETVRRAHLRESLYSHEEAQRLQRMCRELKNKLALTKVLNRAHERSRLALERARHRHRQAAGPRPRTDRDATGDLLDLELGHDPDFDLLPVVMLSACSKFTITLTSPDFTAHKIEDPFRRLGPIAIFSARRHWTAPRSIRLQKGSNTIVLGGRGGGTVERRRVLGRTDDRTQSSSYGSGSGGSSYSNHTSQHSSGGGGGGRCCGECASKTNYYNDSRACRVCLKDVCHVSERDRDGVQRGSEMQLLQADAASSTNEEQETASFGFSIRGDTPVMIASVELNSLADLGGIKEGDFIVELCGVDVKWYTMQQMQKLIHNCGSSIELKVITPMDRNYQNPIASANHCSQGSISTLSGSSSSGISSDSAPSPTGTTSKQASKSHRTKLGKPRLSSFTSGSWNPFRRAQNLGKTF